MKILLVGFTTLARMPYANLYLDALTNTGNEVHLLSWNRDGKSDYSHGTAVHSYHEFRLPQEDQVARITKIPGFLRYRHYVMRLVKEHDFDLLVVMHTIPALILWDLLRWRYRGRYILDFRDLTFERFPPYRAAIGGIANRAAAVFVSSDAFRAFLPSNCVMYTTHNIDRGVLKYRDIRRVSSRNAAPIRVRFWGLIRHETINREVIDHLANDPRFELHYHGSEGVVASDLRKHVMERGAQNVHFHGAYLPEARYEFAGDTDILLNVYEDDATTTYAMGNKFYDGIAFYIPQLCTVGSYMGERVARSQVGLEVDPSNSGFANAIYDYYGAIPWDDFEANCDQEMGGVMTEYQDSVRAIARMVAGGRGFENRGLSSEALPGRLS